MKNLDGNKTDSDTFWSILVFVTVILMAILAGKNKLKGSRDSHKFMMDFDSECIYLYN